MITSNQINWIAGILEGEGCFSHQGTPRIDLVMTDEDVIARARDILNKNEKIAITKAKLDNRKTSYKIVIFGSLAMSWMMSIYPLMGRRRKEKIREILILWKENRNTESYDENRKRRDSPINLAARALAKMQNISVEEALAFIISNKEGSQEAIH